jgi:hypothetical protein
MGKIVKFPDGAAGAVGIALVVLATLFLVNRVLPAKVKSVVMGA